MFRLSLLVPPLFPKYLALMGILFWLQGLHMALYDDLVCNIFSVAL